MFEVGDTVRCLSEFIFDPPKGSICVIVGVDSDDNGTLWAVKWFGKPDERYSLWEEEMELIDEVHG